ncbi:MAG: FAD:protein FMN transferase [Xanthomonadales bacterium]|nr:FAD:protein FMN transferase [Xanthomonadales bacterium]
MLPTACFALLTLLSLLVASACSRYAEYRAEFFVFGTVLEVVLWTDDEVRAREAFGKLRESFQLMHRDWHPWEPGKLTGINEAFARGYAVTADPSLIELTRLSQDMERRTDGRFNAAVGALVRLWGFHSSEYPIEGPPPAMQAIAEIVRRQPSTLNIRIEGQLMSSTNNAVQLDFGGIAKGYAVDRACELLKTLGIDNAIVNAGGDLRAIGRHGDRSWRIAVRNPAGGIIGSLETQGEEAVFTSGNYERFRRDQERRYPHILDPRTGWPVEGLVSVTVIAADGAFADAAATALIVAGSDQWVTVARSLGLDEVLLIDESGTVQMTPQIAARIELAEGIESVVKDPGEANGS